MAAAKYSVPYTSPVGRLVQGDAFEAQTKDQQGNLRVVKSGPNMGQPNPTYFVALAFAKTYGTLEHEIQQGTEFGRLIAGPIDAASRATWPALFPTPGAPGVNPLFSNKIKDGDGIDRNGKPNAEKEGFAGHWIVSFGSSYAPKVVRANAGAWEVVTNPATVKRGHYVRIAGSISSNESLNTPGMYVNLDMVEWVAFGTEIAGGPQAATVFAAPAVLPAGASASPIGGGALPPATAPAAPAAYAPPAAPAAYAPPAAPAAYAPPVNTTYMAPPPAPAAPAAPLSQAGHSMTAAAGGLTREQYHASGWSDDQLIANGYMVA